MTGRVTTMGLVCFVVGATPGPLRAQAAGAGDTLRLTLADAVSMAAQRSAGVEEAQLATSGASSRVVQERASLLPDLSVTAQRLGRTFNTASFGLEFPAPEGQPPLFDPRGEVVGPVQTVDARGTLQQTLFDWSAVERVKGARASLAASRERESQAEETAAVGAALSYVQDLRAQARLEAADEGVTLAAELVDIATDVLDAGVGVRLDVTRAQAQLAGMQAQRITAQADARKARLALLRALDLPLDAGITLADSLPGAIPDTAAIPPVDRTVESALANRAEVRVLDQELHAARLESAAIRAERLPRLSLVADDGFFGGSYDRMLNTYTWAIQATVPLFDGFDRSARQQEKHAEISTWEARRRDIHEQVAFEVRSARLELTAAAQRIGAARARLDLAQAEYDQARERFQAGVAGNADVVSAALRLNEARTAEVDARAAYESARVTLAAASGEARQIH